MRRISFILATVGDCKVVFLDEPSTGLDPHSRAQLWKVVQEVKQRATVVLTTHDMEEAELLGDKSRSLTSHYSSDYGPR